MGSREIRERVDEAMREVPRARFLPPEQVVHAAHDGPLRIAGGQTSSQPRTVRDMLELLDVRVGHRVLDVGSGSGWTTAILAHLVGHDGLVIGIERVADLVTFGRERVAAAGMPWASVRRAVPGVLGAPEDGPFDRILVSAEAPVLSGSLVAQIAPHGVLVAPVAGQMVRTRRRRGRLTTETFGHYRFVPLIVDEP